MTFAAMKSTPVRLVVAILATAAVAGCAGENLFSVAGVGASGPEVGITSPTEAAEVTAGSPLPVAADAVAQAGAANVEYKGVYDDGTAAYLTQSASLNGLVSLSLNATLAPVAGQDEGAARIIVTVTDQTGQVGADTVNITITTTNE